MTKTADPILQTLKDQGHRMTKAREAIVTIMLEAKTPLSASEMHALLAQKGININKVTAYRECQFLEKEEVLHGVKFNDGVKRYCVASHGHHHHLICIECNAVQDVEMENDLDAIEKKIKKEKAFTVKSHALEFYGLCRKCA